VPERMKENSRLKSFAEIVFLIAATAFLAHSIWLASVKTHGFAAVGHGIETDRCEIFLELSDAFEVMTSFLAGSIEPLEAARASNAQSVLEGAEKCLNEAAKADPDDPACLTKLIIVRHKLKVKDHGQFERLANIRTDESERFKEGLSAAYGFATPKLPQATQTDKSDSKPNQGSIKVPSQDVPKQLKSSKAKPAIADAERSAKKEFIEQHLPGGWFGQHAMLDWQIRTGQVVQAQLTQKSIDEHAHSFLILFGLFVVCSLISLFVGALIVIVQLFLIGRRMTPPDQLPLVLAPANYGWLQIYKVFVLWLLTQIIVGTLCKKIMPDANASVLAVSLFIMFTYTVSNVAGLFYIYWFGLRPHQIKFLDGVKLRLRVGKIGPVGMVFAGIGTWFACLPVVLIAYLVASRYLGSHGSTNPVVSKIRDAAHAQDPLAIALFYITIGVIAPICEESLFRGFLYPSLRRVMSVPMAMILSAAAFSLAHLDIGAILPLFALGCVFAFVVERTKSIVPSIIAHGLWNSGTFTLVLLLFSG
jgi:membrane protease YdiL (CAAX protease family)